MPKHVAYFILKKNHKTFKKGTKTQLRKRLGDFFELNKRNGAQIRFRQDKWNKELFEPLYSERNLKSLEKELILEYNDLISFSCKKNIEKFGLNIKITFNWNWGSYYEIEDIDVILDKKFYKTKLEKEIGTMLCEDIKYSSELHESFMSEEIEKGNNRIEYFLKKCDDISLEVGFDVFENYLN